jgi:hypothetical protein
MSNCNTPQGWSNGPGVTNFHPMFNGTLFMVGSGSNQQSLTLMQVLWLNNKSYSPKIIDPDNLGAHIVASLLNAQSGKTPSTILSASAVIGIWNEWMSHGGPSGGYFEPTAGVQWGSAQIVNYLTSLMS